MTSQFRMYAKSIFVTRSVLALILFCSWIAQVSFTQAAEPSPSLATAKFRMSCFNAKNQLLTNGGKPADSSRYAESALLWDPDLNKILLEFPHEEAIHALSFSPDGKYIATGGGTYRVEFAGPKDTDIRLWDASSGKEIRRFKGHKDNVLSLQFSPDGKLLLSGGGDNVRLWDVDSARQLFAWPSNPEGKASFSSDGQCVLTFQSNRATVRDIQGKEVGRFNSPPQGSFASAEFSPDAQYVVTASYDKSVRLWNVRTGEQTRLFSGHADYVYTARFSNDGAWILSASNDKTAIIWDVAKGDVVRKFVHPRKVFNATFSPDHSRIVSLWQPPQSPAISPDNPYLAGITIWNATTGEKIRQIETHNQDYSPMPPAFTADGKLCLLHIVKTDTIPAANITELVDIETGKTIREFK